MKIVYVDVENLCVVISDGSSSVTVPWSDMDSLIAEIDGFEVYYVTNVESVPGRSIVELVSKMSGQDVPSLPENGGQKYLHSTVESRMGVPGASGDRLIIEGTSKFIPLDENMTLLAKYPLLKSLIQSGKIEIVNEHQKKTIISKLKDKREALMATRQKVLDSMIVKTSVDDFIKEGGSGNSDVISLDIEGEGDFKKEQEQEAYKNLKALKIEVKE